MSPNADHLLLRSSLLWCRQLTIAIADNPLRFDPSDSSHAETVQPQGGHDQLCPAGAQTGPRAPSRGERAKKHPSDGGEEEDEEEDGADDDGDDGGHEAAGANSRPGNEGELSRKRHTAIHVARRVDEVGDAGDLPIPSPGETFIQDSGLGDSSSSGNDDSGSTGSQASAGVDGATASSTNPAKNVGKKGKHGHSRSVTVQPRGASVESVQTIAHATSGRVATTQGGVGRPGTSELATLPRPTTALLTTSDGGELPPGAATPSGPPSFVSARASAVSVERKTMRQFWSLLAWLLFPPNRPLGPLLRCCGRDRDGCFWRNHQRIHMIAIFVLLVVYVATFELAVYGLFKPNHVFPMAVTTFLNLFTPLYVVKFASEYPRRHRRMSTALRHAVPSVRARNKFTTVALASIKSVIPAAQVLALVYNTLSTTFVVVPGVWQLALSNTSRVCLVVVNVVFSQILMIHTSAVSSAESFWMSIGGSIVAFYSRSLDTVLWRPVLTGDVDMSDEQMSGLLQEKMREHFHVRNAVLKLCTPNAVFVALYLVSACVSFVGGTIIISTYSPRWNPFFVYMTVANILLTLTAVPAVVRIVQEADSVERRVAHLLVLPNLLPAAESKLISFLQYVRSCDFRLRIGGVVISRGNVNKGLSLFLTIYLLVVRNIVSGGLASGAFVV